MEWHRFIAVFHGWPSPRLEVQSLGMGWADRNWQMWNGDHMFNVDFIEQWFLWWFKSDFSSDLRSQHVSSDFPVIIAGCRRWLGGHHLFPHGPCHPFAHRLGQRLVAPWRGRKGPRLSWGCLVCLKIGGLFLPKCAKLDGWSEDLMIFTKMVRTLGVYHMYLPFSNSQILVAYWWVQTSPMSRALEVGFHAWHGCWEWGRPGDLVTWWPDAWLAHSDDV